jgi:hypothetical protein
MLSLNRSLVSLSESGDFLFYGSVVFNIGIVSDTSSSVSEKLLVDTAQRSVLVPDGLFDTISVVL